MPPGGRLGKDMQPDNGPVSLQGRSDRETVQPMLQGLPAESVTHRALHT